MKQLELPLECKNEDHNWSYWSYGLLGQSHSAISTCNICGAERLLVPRNPEDTNNFVKATKKMVDDYIRRLLNDTSER